MSIINRLGHAVDVYLNHDRTVHTIPPVRRDHPVRLVPKAVKECPPLVDGLPAVAVTMRLSQDLPRPCPGVWHLVSSMVFDYVTDRDDLLCPSDLVVDAGGRVIGCRALRRRYSAKEKRRTV